MGKKNKNNSTQIVMDEKQTPESFKSERIDPAMIKRKVNVLANYPVVGLKYPITGICNDIYLNEEEISVCLRSNAKVKLHMKNGSMKPLDFINYKDLTNACVLDVTDHGISYDNQNQVIPPIGVEHPQQAAIKTEEVHKEAPAPTTPKEPAPKAPEQQKTQTQQPQDTQKK